MSADNVIHPDVRIGHVHLSLSDLDRATAFYHGVLGFKIAINGQAFGLNAVFLNAGDYHHHIALNTFTTKGAVPPPKGHTGLYHFAILYPSRAQLMDAVRRLAAIDYPIESAVDHGGSVAFYLRDPDDNGVELSYDLPRSEWFDAQGQPILKAVPFDWRALLEDEVALAGA
jgi:catechol 2,3-dioxygenase